MDSNKTNIYKTLSLHSKECKFVGFLSSPGWGTNLQDKKLNWRSTLHSYIRYWPQIGSLKGRIHIACGWNRQFNIKSYIIKIFSKSGASLLQMWINFIDTFVNDWCEFMEIDYFILSNLTTKNISSNIKPNVKVVLFPSYFVHNIVECNKLYSKCSYSIFLSS